MTYQLHPQVETLLAMVEAAGRPEVHHLPPAEARVLFNEVIPPVAGDPLPVGSVADRMIPGPGGDLPIRFYRPTGAGTQPLPVLVYFHGGGWVIGDLESHDQVCRWFCEKAAIAVAAIDYRLAPEHRYPAAVEDCDAATQWVSDNAAALGVDPARLAVAGDSAGGNLAAVVCHLARDRGGPPIKFQLLIYPSTDMTMSHPSVVEMGDGYRLTREAMDWFIDHYTAGADLRDPKLSPLFADNHGGLPPALVVTAGFDPLRDEGKAYADKLQAAETPVDYICYDDMLHGFVNMPGFLDVARDGLQHMAVTLKRALG